MDIYLHLLLAWFLCSVALYVLLYFAPDARPLDDGVLLLLLATGPVGLFVGTCLVITVYSLKLPNVGILDWLLGPIRAPKRLK